MRKIILVVLLLHFSNLLFNQQHLYPFKRGHLFGLKNQDGKVIIRPIYESISNYKEGFSVAKIEYGDYGYLDSTGNPFTEFKYDMAYPFKNGLAKVSIFGKIGFINKQGKEIIPIDHLSAEDFKEGFVKVKNKDFDEGLIDTSGHLFMNKYFHKIRISEGIISIEELNDETKTGIITVDYAKKYYKINGEPFIDKWFEMGSEFENGRAIVLLNNKAYELDLNGQLTEIKENPLIINEEKCLGTIATVHKVNSNTRKIKLYPFKDDKYYGYKDENNKIVIQPIYVYVDTFYEGLAVVENKHFYFGYIDTLGKVIIPFNYIFARRFSCGVAEVQDKSENFYFINKKGNKKMYGENVYEFIYNYAKFSKDSKYGLMDTAGNLFMGRYFNYVSDFHDGYIKVEVNNAVGSGITNSLTITGYYNENGELLGNKWFSTGTDFYNGKAGVIYNDQEYCIDTAGTLIENLCEGDWYSNSIALYDSKNSIRPEFPGGDAELSQWISKNLRYPDLAKGKGWSDKVFVQFVVDKNGDVNDITIIKGRYPVLNEEVIRIIKSMPKWKPATINGKPVKVSFQLPVKFKISRY